MIRVLIGEDEGLFRDMLKISLSAIPNLEVVDAVSDGKTAIDAADRLMPDVVLMDIELGSEPNGIAAGRSIKQDHEEIGIVVLSAHKEREYVDLVSKEDYAGWSYLIEAVGQRCRSVGPGNRGLGIRPGGYGPLGGQQHAATQRFPHRPAHAPSTRSVGDDGPGVQ
ncbi:MAG: response regulator [Dehalococcoidia bacterium]|nr:response regulator [Dehalococcoidia bacterium]